MVQEEGRSVRRAWAGGDGPSVPYGAPAELARTGYASGDRLLPRTTTSGSPGLTPAPGDARNSRGVPVADGRSRVARQAGIQLPWKPCGTRRGIAISATGARPMSRASRTAQTEPSDARSYT
jgi:hypothetical protein